MDNSENYYIYVSMVLVCLFIFSLILSGNRPERFEPRCARGEQFEIHSEQLSDDGDEDNSVVEKIEPEEREEELDHDGTNSVDSYESLSDFPRLRFVNPQEEPEPKDEQVLLLVSQCLTSTPETGGQRTRINHPLRYRILRAL